MLLRCLQTRFEHNAREACWEAQTALAFPNVATKKRDQHDEEPTSASEQLGRIVKARRLEAGGTQTDLAELMTKRGFSWRQSTVNRIETGLRPITWDEAVMLASLLSIDLAEAANTRERLLAKIADIDRQGEQTFKQLSEQKLVLEQQLAELDEREERISLHEHAQTKAMELIARKNPKPAAKTKKPAAKTKRQRKAR
jgi:transcriptional regulator with XRE-family HTH domain